MAKILVTGATGYIGGRLVPLLIEQGHQVTVFVRDSNRISGREWFSDVEIIEGNLLETDEEWYQSQPEFDVAYYLVHSMYASRSFGSIDAKAANHFCHFAKNIKKVIYLGGLLPEGENVSKHLESRAETGEILRKSLPVTEFRAGPIIGSGSASFEMIRYLTERLPIMITPKWVFNEVQPIGIFNVINYLSAAVDKEPLGIVEIGGDPISFKNMMLEYASVRKLKRYIIPLPLLTPNLAARWVGLVTPIPNSIAVPLVEGVNNPILADTKKAKEHFPEIEPMNYKQAVVRALQKMKEKAVTTRWSSGLNQAYTYKMQDWEGMIKEQQSIYVNASAQSVFQAFSSLGGDKGWLAWNWTWKVRGFIDKLVGGPGLRRGRRFATHLIPGEALDFWRVESVTQNEHLLLRAEMKVPGKAWLKLETHPEGDGARFQQTAFFAPKGFWGAVYWYALLFIHKLIFKKMVKAIAKEAEQIERNKTD